MIIFVTLIIICWFVYAMWIIDVMVKKFDNELLGLFCALFCIFMPIAVFFEVLIK